MTFKDKDYSPANGVSLWETCPQLSAMDPATAFTFFDDFYQYVANNSDQTGWITTKVEAGAGDAAITIDDAAGGILKIVNDAADDDSVQIQWHAENFKLASGKPLWFETRLKCNSANQNDVIAGLCITDTTLLGGMSDGVYFRKDDGDPYFDFITEKNTNETETSQVGTMVTDTYIRLGFYFDGAGTVYAYVNGVNVATHTTNIVDDEDLTVSFAFANGEAVAKTIYIDYVKVVQVR